MLDHAVGAHGAHAYLCLVTSLRLPTYPLTHAAPRLTCHLSSLLPSFPPQDKSTSMSPDRSTLSNLSAYLTLAHAKEKHGFDPAKFGEHRVFDACAWVAVWTEPWWAGLSG